MASELRVNTLKDASGNNSVATSVVFNGTCKAWAILMERQEVYLQEIAQI